MKKALFIGGTGTISAAITQRIAAMDGWQLTLINRGNRNAIVPSNVEIIEADINNTEDVSDKLKGMTFDCICDFIGFIPEHVERDWKLFRNRTAQYIFISSASAYQKPCRNHIITEDTPLCNPFWQYSRNKIACEEFLFNKYHSDGFPITVVRPSHTYDNRSIPTCLHGKNGSWQVARRIMEGKKVILCGDGESLWTLTHNSDFAKGFTGLMGNERAIGEAFHITSDESLTWNRIYSYLAAALGKELKVCHIASETLAAAGTYYDFNGSLFGDKSCSVVFDNSKLKSIVPDFHADIRYEQGVKMAVDNILENPVLQRKDPEFDQWCDNMVNACELLKKKILP